MRWLKFLISAVITAGLVYLLMVPLRTPFPVGEFLSPFHGFWHNAQLEASPDDIELAFAGLEESVELVYDERGVPHIFAQNDHDLAFAQGYVTAKDRLWQMEFQTHFVAGRLAEILPANLHEQVIPVDRQNRQLGLAYAAELADSVMKDHPGRPLLEAYANGVNAYISSLNPKDYPLEYKILNYRPEPWSPLKTYLLLKYMADNLARRNYDVEYTRALGEFGQAKFDSIYPQRPQASSPIIPVETKWDFERTVPEPPAPTGFPSDTLMGLTQAFFESPDENIGSNNWAIAGSKSSTGHPMLASDPHLQLNLPSIWYEIQLHAPDVNVYGVSLPGAPNVIIGFNDSIAWGVTNAGRDVLDFYRIRFRDASKSEYKINGEWRKVKKRIEHIKRKGQTELTDTILYTDLGPIWFEENAKGEEIALTMRWMAYEPSFEAQAFYDLNRANNYDDYVEALKTYVCPAQNFVFASTTGDIAIWQQGKFVDRWNEQGRFIMDANQPSHHWNAFIPQEHNPHVKNPERGFVSSANQAATGPDYPYNYHGSFEGFRNRRINELLASKEKFTKEDMYAFQQDNYSVLAADVLPLMLSSLDSSSYSSDPFQAGIVAMLKKWDYNYSAQSIEATIFNEWWDQLDFIVWEDDFAGKGEMERPKQWALRDLLLSDSRFSFYDNKETPKKENRQDVIRQAFGDALTSLKNISPDPENWKWADYKATSIMHLLRGGPFAAFGRLNLDVGGYRSILNATSERNGPSWRMVVSLEPGNVQAYGVYPGGQSGSVANPGYDSFINTWIAGEYYPLWKMNDPNDEDVKIEYKQKLINP